MSAERRLHTGGVHVTPPLSRPEDTEMVQWFAQSGAYGTKRVSMDKLEEMCESIHNGGLVKMLAVWKDGDWRGVQVVGAWTEGGSDYDPVGEFIGTAMYRGKDGTNVAICAVRHMGKGDLS
jgi:hypothetical protein